MSDVSDGFGNANQNHMMEYHILPVRRPTTKDLKWKSQFLGDSERLGVGQLRWELLVIQALVGEGYRCSR